MSSQSASHLNDTAVVAAPETCAPGGIIELLLGPYRSGKTTKIIEEIISTHRSQPFSKSVVIVPSQRYQKVFEDRLAKSLAESTHTSGAGTALGSALGTGLETSLAALGTGLVSVTVMNFYSLVQRLLRQSGSSFRLVPQGIRPQVIARVMSRLKQEGALPNLHEHSAFLGIHNNLMALIDEFERAALSPEEVLSRLELTAQSTSRYVELSTIYKVYWQILDELNLIDERQAAFALVRMLTSSDPAIGFDNLFVDGFDRFNRLQLLVLSEVAKRIKRTSIGFDYAFKDGDIHPDYLWKEASYRLLRSHLSSAMEKPFPVNVDQLTSSPAAVFRFAASDRFLEMEEIARRVKSALLIDKIPAQDILVVVRNLTLYADAARAAFEDAGISYFVDEPEDCGRLPVIQFISRLTRLEFDGLLRRDVLSCLRSRYLSEKAQISPQEIEHIDRRSLAQRVVGGREQWQQLFEASTEVSTEVSTEESVALDGQDAEANGGWWQDVGVKLFELFDRLKPLSRATAGAHVRWLEDVLDHLFQPLFANRRSGATEGEDFTDRRFVEQKAVGEYRRCLSTLLLEEAFFGEESLSCAEFFGRLDRLLTGANFRNFPKSTDAVIICGADLAPNRSFSRVFIGGLVEGEFPRKVGATGFVGPEEIRLWNSFDVDISNPRFHPAFETSLFANLTARSRDELHLSYPSYEFTGEELLPSFLLNLCENSKPIAETNAGRRAVEMPISARNWLSGSLLSVSPFARLDKGRELFQDACQGRMGPCVKQLAEQLQENVAMLHGRLALDRQTVFNGHLCREVLNGSLTVPLPRRFSATGLSDYGKCGFRYWVSHILRSEPAEEPRVGLDAKLLGEVCHKSLELFYANLTKNKLRITDSLEVLEACLDHALVLTLQWLEAKRTFRPTEFWHLEKAEIRFRLKRFLYKERERAFKDKYSFTPYLLEAGFGLDNDESFPPLILGHGEESIEIRGRIDRIDKATDASGREILRLIDYKKGSTPIAAEEAYRGRNLQLPLYALAAGTSIEAGADVVEGRYLSIWSGAISGRLQFGKWEKLDDPQKRPLLEQTEASVSRFVQEITSGKFTVQPNGLDLCKRCPHRVVCRISELKPALEDDPDRASQPPASTDSGGDQE